MEIKDLEINISDNVGKLRNIDEIEAQLLKVETTFDTIAISDYTLYLLGQKNMLKQIINYLHRI